MAGHALRFPRGPQDLTPQWLTYALRSSQALPIGQVVSVQCALLENQGQASRVYGLTLEYTGYPSPPPTKLVAKIPPLSTYQSDQELWRGFVSEATFYQPRTRVHFDMHTGQVMAGVPNRPAMLIDWATVRWGSPASDVGVTVGPWGAPYELRWARLYHGELSQQLGRDQAWPWEQFHLLFRAAPPQPSIVLYITAFMSESQLEQTMAILPDRTWFPRPTWQECYLQWPAQWIERQHSIEALAELEVLGQAALDADNRLISTPSTEQSAASEAQPAAGQTPVPLRRSIPPPSLSLSSAPPARSSAPPLVLVPRHARGPEKRFPTGIEDLTPQWLSDALMASGALPQGEVVRVEAELVQYQGQVSRVYGLLLEYSGCDQPPPTRLVAKIPPNVSYQPSADVHQNNVCEAVFYRHYGRDPLLPIPTCYYADVQSQGKPGFVLLLQDLRPLIPLEYATKEQALDDGMLATMRSIAALHARFWRRQALARENWLNPGIYRSHPESAAWYREVVSRVRARHNAKLSVPMQQFCELVQTESQALLVGFAMFPRTLIHFDVHPRKIMFGAGSKAMLIDWGACMYGMPVVDACLDGGPWTAQREARWHRTYYVALSEHLAADHQRWAWDDCELCVRSHPPRLDILLYALAYMDEAQWEDVTRGQIDRPWLKAPSWQQYCFDWITDWMERHRSMEACAEVLARGEALLKVRP